MDAYVEMKGVSKAFGTVAAAQHVDFHVKKGEIHALLGENGSGKSTLMNMLAGIYAPDEGEIRIGSKPVQIRSPKDAISMGIGMVHQHFKLVDVFTAKENIIAGRKNGFFRRDRRLSREIEAIGETFGLVIHPDRKIYQMSVGEKQTVEIVKMLYRGADVLILDEPTAVLTPQEIKVLFGILRNMKDQGCAVVLITHKLNEVMEISDRVTVLRKGETVGTVETRDTTPRALTELMVGRPMTLEITRVEAERSKEAFLQVQDLDAVGAHDIKALSSMSFSLHGGEILGVAGIAGSGQKELCEVLAGLYKASGGSVKFLGEEILGLSPIEILRKGVSMSFVPEDRLGMGLVGSMDITNNVLLRTFQKNKGVFVDFRKGRKQAEHIVDAYDVSTPSVDHVLKKLSGGNIQKVLLGREVDLNPKLLITAYPVRGLDIGASYRVYDILNQQKQAGVAVLFIGEDLDVLMQLSDRILVMHGGAVMDIVDPRVVTKEDLGLLMLGHKPGEEDAS